MSFKRLVHLAGSAQWVYNIVQRKIDSITYFSEVYRIELFVLSSPNKRVTESVLTLSIRFDVFTFTGFNQQVGDRQLVNFVRTLGHLSGFCLHCVQREKCFWFLLSFDGFRWLGNI